MKSRLVHAAWHKLPRQIRSWWRTPTRIPCRAANPYATHVPVLVGLAKLFRIVSVIEFGSGRHSTATFLDRALFPDLQQLKSFENDVGWYDTVTREVGTDPRLRITLVAGSMAAAAARHELSSAQLILIDDSRSASERAATIEAVVPRVGCGSVVVIHDFEVAEYRSASVRLPHRFEFDQLSPRTGILSRSPVPRRELRALNRAIGRNRCRIAPENAARWHHVLSQ